MNISRISWNWSLPSTHQLPSDGGRNAGPDVSLMNKAHLYFQCMLLLQQTYQGLCYFYQKFCLKQGTMIGRGGRSLAVLTPKSRSQLVWSWTCLLYAFFFSPIHATCTDHLILLVLLHLHLSLFYFLGIGRSFSFIIITFYVFNSIMSFLIQHIIHCVSSKTSDSEVGCC
jgi:hypothetical protein